jgi:glycine betaine/proline transport system ATP-binding protein
MSKIEVRNIYKIFGPHPERWLDEARSGVSKDELLAKSGHTLGLRDISLSIEEGSIFVIMGLSGSGKSTLIRHFNRLIEPSAGQILVDGEVGLLVPVSCGSR